MSKWDTRFLEMALLVAGWSKDPRTQVGAVIADPEHRVVGVGYNGYPRGFKDSIATDSRELKHRLVIHAEVNAILNAVKPIPEGCTLYVTHPVCDRCVVTAAQAGIFHIVAIEDNRPHDDDWQETQALVRRLCREESIQYTLKHYPVRYE